MFNKTVVKSKGQRNHHINTAQVKVGLLIWLISLIKDC